MEQRIGRLDRIGQIRTIEPHIPYVPCSAYLVLARWYHDGLNAFEQMLPAGNRFLLEFHDRLRTLALSGTASGFQEQMIALIRDSRTYRQELTAHLEKGRDRLLEQTSFRPAVAADLVRVVCEQDADTGLDRFMMDAWDYFGFMPRPCGNEPTNWKPLRGSTTLSPFGTA